MLLRNRANAFLPYRYNTTNHPVPFMKASNIIAPKKQAKEVPDLEEAIEESDDGGEEVDNNVADDEDDLKKDKYIKQPKRKTNSRKKTVKKGVDENVSEKPKKGRSRPATKGKAK